MNGETSSLLRTLAGQVQARDPDAQLATIQRIGLARLFAPETLVTALGVGGRGLVLFIAELGTEHATEPERFERVLRACAAAEGAGLDVALAAEIARICTQPAARRAVPAHDGLVILDDIFPLLQSGFRLAEYNSYLGRYANAAVYSTGSAFRFANETRPLRQVVADYEAAFPEFAGRVRALGPKSVPAARLYYTVFVNNAHRFLPFAEATRTPFVFTLYPGGGFQLNDAACDAKLRRIFASPCFRKVIVTQAITERYLHEKNLCPPASIRPIFGGVLPAKPTRREPAPKRRYGLDKDSLDICFAANKYMPGGIDKGFDTFLAVARRIAGEFPAARFHVAGTFTAADGDLTGLADRIAFHGCLPTEALHAFFRDMDLILSPNLPFQLKPGAFDGFPTGSCVEAGLCGVAVFCTDELGLNTVFRAGEEIVIVRRDADEIFTTVAGYCRAPASLHALAARGAAALQRVFSLEEQMNPRFAVLDELLAA